MQSTISYLVDTALERGIAVRLLPKKELQETEAPKKSTLLKGKAHKDVVASAEALFTSGASMIRDLHCGSRNSQCKFRMINFVQ
jgi:hypothetical protein